MCIKVSYSNGNYLIISCNTNTFGGYIGEYAADGKVVEFFGCFDNYDCFVALVNDWFDKKIPAGNILVIKKIVWLRTCPSSNNA